MAQQGTERGDAAAETVTAPVKLVVWDLDDTLWAGTLSEGPVVVDPARGEQVRQLNQRGILNSVCSKNDPDAARARLEEAGLLDQFVFSSIDWSPKGPRVAQIVEEVQLRPENVLFVDDLPLNRAEVAHFAPGIQTAGPEILDRLLSLPQLAGKDDAELSRLRQYRILERKQTDRKLAPESSEAFLRSCDIRVGVYYDAENEIERLYELVSRTHQLNFTKRRPSRPEFETMLADPERDVGYIRVRDRYGDYGICGFYSVSSTGELDDFLFSCRVLHMGVEQWLYEHLGRPRLATVGEVASSLEGPVVDWVTMDNEGCDAAAAPGGKGRKGPRVGDRPLPDQRNRVLMVGGCDLETTAQFLGGRITTDFAHVGANGSFVHVGHTELLRQSVAGLSEAQRELVGRLPFVDQGVYESPAVVVPDYDVLVLSALTDYTQGLYRHRALGLIVAWYQFDRDVTDPSCWPPLEKRYGREGVDEEFLAWFAGEFEYLGGISPAAFQNNIRWLSTRLPAGAELVVINGAEVVLDDPREPDRHLRHKIMNSALDEVAETLPNVTVCDVRTFVLSESDLTDSIRHYRRYAYAEMADRIRQATDAELIITRPNRAVRAYRACYRFAGRRRVQVRRARRRLRRAMNEGRPSPR